MSDTVTIHHGHCSYHGPADKAPAWARGQIPAPTTSFEDTTHAWEEGYRAGMAFAASGRATEGEGLNFSMDGTQKGKIPVSEANSGPIGKEIW